MRPHLYLKNQELAARSRGAFLNADTRYNEQLLRYQPDNETGYYAGIDAIGRHQIKLKDGVSIIYAEAASPGAIAINEKVMLYRSAGGKNFFTAMS